MQIKTFRAKTMPQALDLVRRELGPEAMVLHTRELNGSLVGRMLWGRAYEIAATPAPRGSAPTKPAPVPSPSREGRGRVTAPSQPTSPTKDDTYHVMSLRIPSSIQHPAPSIAAPQPPSQLAELQSLVEALRARNERTPHRDMPPALFDLFTTMIEADIDEQLARELVDRLRSDAAALQDLPAARLRLSALLESDLRTAGPIALTPGKCRRVALVGPTGVGKTTTVAKLAANFRLRDNRRVGLITVDTYRIAAVEQLRTYAEIIDLPMEVVSTPRDMREAAERMQDFDLVLLDTAGRSPRDEVRIRELRAMLAEAAPDEVHLVLSAASSARTLAAAAEKFAPVGVTSLLITKLDEATALGGLVALARQCRLPFSYLTDGQNVPDDIAVADPNQLAQLILNLNI